MKIAENLHVYVWVLYTIEGPCKNQQTNIFDFWRKLHF